MRRKKMQISSKIKLNNALRRGLIILSVIIFATGSGNLINSFLTKTEVVTGEKEIYKYTNKFSEDVNVNLKDNQFVTEDEIVEGQTYLSDLISNIDVDMNYQYADSKPTEVKYKYKIEATIKAVYSNNRSSYDVLNKTEILKEEEKVVNSQDLSINEKINVDYSKYHEMIKNFKQEMGITVESYLDIKLTVHTKANIGSKEVENEYSSDYNITLGDKIALIQDRSKAEDSKTIKQQPQSYKELKLNYVKITINAIVMLAGIILLRIILSKTEKLNMIKNEYKLELNRILKSCESKLVQIEDLKQIDIENATRVKDIYQLLKLSDEALVPIYCYIKEEPENEAYFIVTKYEKSYIYVLR